MPNKITERDVCRQIIECRKDALEKLRELGASTVRYTIRNFTEDMLTDSFIASKTTVDLKWKTLRIDGVVIDCDKTTALHIPNAYIRAGLPCPVSGKKAPHTQKNTQTGEGSE